MKLACLAVVALASLSGCAAAGGLAGLGMNFAVASAAASQAQPEPVRVVYAAPPGYVLVAEPEPTEPALPEPPPPRKLHGPQFQAAAARNLLDAVSMDVCKDVAGLPSGWGHARVTFEPDGHASAVTIDAPMGMPAEAVSCVSARLSSVAVPEFAGAPMTVGTTWNVR